VIEALHHHAFKIVLTTQTIAEDSRMVGTFPEAHVVLTRLPDREADVADLRMTLEITHRSQMTGPMNDGAIALQPVAELHRAGTLEIFPIL
jgi:hypothetical protein